MTKKEIAEIKKQFCPENCTITRIRGCYVDADKCKKSEMTEAFLSLPEEETFKYFEFFKKTLSGSLGKNLINLAFPLEQEFANGTQRALLALRDNKLTDDTIVEKFYDKIIENYAYNQNYYIVLVHGVYDIPGKSSDGSSIFDASDEIYEFILCCICQVNLSKAGLGYDADNNRMQDLVRNWVVGIPDTGFLFPAFNDRSADIHNTLFYCKKAKELPESFIKNILGCETPLSATKQKEVFKNVVEEVLMADCQFEKVVEVLEKVNDFAAEKQASLEPEVLTGQDMKNIMESCDLREEQMTALEECYEGVSSEISCLTVGNITDTSKFEIQAPEIFIKTVPEKASLITERTIEGRKFLVIPVEGEITINGIRVLPSPSK